MADTAKAYGRIDATTFNSFRRLSDAIPVSVGKTTYMACGLIAIVSLSLAGCSTAGDFGRPKQSTALSELARNYDKVVGVMSPDHSSFVLSREEMDIRTASYHFHQPLPGPLFPKRFANLVHKSRLSSLADYGDSQTSRGYADGNARAGEIDELMASDHVWLKRFASAARLTRASDRERLIVLEEDPGAFSDDDRINAHARIKENADVMLGVLADIDARLKAYEYAVQRTRLEWPRTPLARTETSLSLLRERVARLRVELGFDGTGIQFEEIETVEPVYAGPSMKDRPSKMRGLDGPQKPVRNDDANVMPGFEDPGSKSFRRRQKKTVDKANVMPGFEDPF